MRFDKMACAKTIPIFINCLSQMGGFFEMKR